MPAFRIIAPKDMGEVKKGFEFVVNSNSNDPSNAIREYLTRMGYNQRTISHYSSGNWKFERL